MIKLQIKCRIAQYFELWLKNKKIAEMFLEQKSKNF